MNLYVAVFLSCFSVVLYASGDKERQAIQSRIKPIGQVSVQHEAAAVTPGTNSAVKPGQGTYEHYCIICHQDGLAGAPKFRNASDWQPRLVKKTLDELVASSIKGVNAMPMKGTCIKCSEGELKEVISYMLPQL